MKRCRQVHCSMLLRLTTLPQQIRPFHSIQIIQGESVYFRQKGDIFDIDGFPSPAKWVDSFNLSLSLSKLFIGSSHAGCHGGRSPDQADKTGLRRSKRRINRLLRQPRERREWRNPACIFHETPSSLDRHRDSSSRRNERFLPLRISPSPRLSRSSIDRGMNSASLSREICNFEHGYLIRD